MRLSSLLILAATFATAAGLSLVAAGFSANSLEQSTEIAVRRALDASSYTWTEVTADGLQVELSGTAPDEASRFSVISHIGGVVDAARIIDHIEILPSKGIAPPKFSTEILRNDAGISIIGLIPSSSDHSAVMAHLEDISNVSSVADFLETATYTAPRHWDAALSFGLDALALLPRSKISVMPGQVTITAIANSPEAKANYERRLTRMTPRNVMAKIDIAAPRPVISPFTLRYVLSENGGAFDACSVDTAANRAIILKAAQEARLRVNSANGADCTIGLGVPSSNWTRAVVASLHALNTLGSGSLTLSNTDITLVAAEGTDQTLFEHTTGELDSRLPQVFALHAVLPKPEAQASQSTPEFTATLSPEGQVQLRGRLTDDTLKQAVTSYAKARFGSENIYLATRNVEDLPNDWPLRVLAGLEALSQLERGAVTVLPDQISLSGVSHAKDATAQISRFLSDKLGRAEDYALKLTYEEPPRPADEVISPAICELELAGIQRDEKIAFEPGSATVAERSARVLDKLADTLKHCGAAPLEVQGHTDSQGRESMNQNLSQARAQSVLNALTARRIDTTTYVAKGYGEVTPIADNGTEEGREANRRIEFHLIPSQETQEGAQDANQESTDQ